MSDFTSVKSIGLSECETFTSLDDLNSHSLTLSGDYKATKQTQPWLNKQIEQVEELFFADGGVCWKDVVWARDQVSKVSISIALLHNKASWQSRMNAREDGDKNYF